MTQLVAEERQPDALPDHAPEERTRVAGLARETRYHRSPRALGRLVALVAATLALIGLRHLLDQTTQGLRRDLREAADRLPDAVGPLVDAAAVAIAAAVVLAVAIDATRRARRFALTIVAGAAGSFALLSALSGVGWWWLPSQAPDRWVSAALAAGATGLTITSISASSAWLRRAMLAFSLLALAGGSWVEASLVGRGLLLGVGATMGAAVALGVGTPSRRATATDVEHALRERGFPVASLEPHGGDARASIPWTVELDNGTSLFVKTYSAEERVADLLFRFWRRITLRNSGDRRPFASLEHAVEHETLAGMRAATAGVRAPRSVALGELEGGGTYVIFEQVAGSSFDAVVGDDGPEALTEAALREAWSMVTTLHRAGIAHRDLRSANLVLDEDQRVWIVDFAFADVMADDDLRHRDLAELLASTAALVGTERAVDAAVTTLGPLAWLDALPMVQPLAVSSATRAELGTAGFKELRRALATAIQAPSPDLPRLGRVDGRTVVAIVAIGAAVFALLPQLTQSGDMWSQLPRADRGMLGLAVVASLVTYLGATLSTRGSVPESPAWVPTLLAQLASSFTNRVTPAKAGGVALNARWMVTEGISAPVATAAIGLNALGGMLVHIVLTIFTVVWAGKVGLGDFSLPSFRSIGTAAGLVVAVIVVTMLIPSLRQLVRHRVLPRAKQSLEAVAEVATQPRRLAMLFGGSAIVTASYVAALALCLRAVDASVPLSTVALVYLAGSALAAAAPTPGGLGATEAVFATALAAVGVGESDAVPAVLLYRLITFWMPIIPGWLAFTTLQRQGRI